MNRQQEFKKQKGYERQKGFEYEEKAAVYLRKKGYKILEKNFYTFFGEIDLIAREKDTIVFIEVKYRKSIKNGYPQEAVTYKKRQRIINSAQYYLYQHNALEKPCRFDVIAIAGEELLHIENAFEMR